MNRITVLTCLLVLASQNQAQDKPSSAIEHYRKLEFPPKDENFEKGWKDRVAADYDVINSADLTSLRAALEESAARSTAPWPRNCARAW